MHRQLRFSIWFPIVLVAAFTAGYLFWQQTLIPGPYDLEPMSIVRNGNKIEESSPELVEGWRTYRNEEYGFEIKYPQDWSFKDYSQQLGVNSFGGLFQALFSIYKTGPKQVEFYLEAVDQAELLVVATLSFKPAIGQWADADPGRPERFSAYNFSGFIGIHAGGDQSITGEGGDERLRAYQRLPNGSVIGVTWSRENYAKANDFSYQKYLLPILSTFKFIE